MDQPERISPALVPATTGFNFLFSSGDDIQVIIDALARVTRIDVVSAPKLLVLNNQTATLQVGDEV